MEEERHDHVLPKAIELVATVKRLKGVKKKVFLLTTR